ncbi:MAG: hypothetical protein COV74_08835 [Candidatus Omnitrophica bacterium CG11_big_fil_rev_8_21_14_0_20_45_26]|uniref:Glutamate--cysteine ligase n=1 Tax=Candidatus Abzuiibacterium crystallinum TaxID=1974748 RepID=A0A2H0LM26_9BACT|nr:MAG: hypothetical protein COV74_08835 [Candidatus Omnitrophica bacterium CG11_big_fil_rev_8_21_14_0_20_45_26]PIW64421.1 MAG: hypothetical protein COW12_06180 [Candidatus Omnitrophica bacterium CG12_big_fil_rev_8_21_14_0_65_45_16]
MSTYLESKHQDAVHSIDDLKRYFHQFAKPADKRLVGIECEILAVDSETGEAVNFSGPRGIEAILNALAYQFGYRKIIEAGRTVALEKQGTLISLEPGGQIELSASPVKNVHEVKRQLDQFFFELKTIRHFIDGVKFLTYSIQPFSLTKDIEWVPKTRYKIMSAYLIEKGRLAHDMMKRTAANQAAFDYASEEDAFEKMCLVMRLTSIVSAMFANSPFSKGKASGFLTERMHIWRFTDPSRSGLQPSGLCTHATFEEYLSYILELPMMFIVRNHQWIKVNRLTFKRFIEKGYRGEHATQQDFELHLSSFFPEARFKQYLEVRGADAQRANLIPAIPAFWKGILYHEPSKKKACDLIRHWTQTDHFKLHRDIEIRALKAKVRGKLVLDLARQLVSIAEEGLAADRQFNECEEDERIYLTPLKALILEPGETEAERLLRLWRGPFREKKEALLSYLAI